MCGRFTQAYTWTEVHKFLSTFGAARNLRPRYNIAPTTMVDVIVDRGNGRELVPMRWGLVPFFWKKTLKEVPATFNARAESASPWMEKFHDRMPVILSGPEIDGWLNGSAGADLLKPAEEEKLRESLVSNRVNKTGVGDEESAAEPLAKAS